MKLSFVKKDGIAVPVLTEEFNKLPVEFVAEVKLSRNPQFFRKFWKLVRVCHHNLPESMSFPTVEKLEKHLLVAAGFYSLQEIGGRKYVIADSIAYEAMDELKFQELYQRVLDEVCKILGVDEGDLINEVSEF